MYLCEPPNDAAVLYAVHSPSISFRRSNFKLFSFLTFNQSKPSLHSCTLHASTQKHARRFISWSQRREASKWDKPTEQPSNQRLECGYDTTYITCTYQRPAVERALCLCTMCVLSIWWNWWTIRRKFYFCQSCARTKTNQLDPPISIRSGNSMPHYFTCEATVRQLYTHESSVRIAQKIVYNVPTTAVYVM